MSRRQKLTFYSIDLRGLWMESLILSRPGAYVVVNSFWPFKHVAASTRGAAFATEYFPLLQTTVG